MSKFRISIECYSELHDFDIWPNGDAPKNPTTQDVIDVINKCGGVLNVLDDWNLWSLDGELNVEEVNH